ncbi:toll-like receptor 4 [Mytilus galloprovincialis]|uniref:toll-like receptor 4 n=1 Tax=Mytilus galloprovincialis TaxID=29158 RepID=UPI003F7C680D
MNILTPETFSFLPQITNLTLSKCHIQFIYNGTFKNMRNLSELDISFNTCLRFKVLENITADLQHSEIKILKVNYIHGLFEMSTILKTSHISNLRNTSLKRFEADGNRIQRIEYGALKYFPKSARSASFRDNIFSIGKYMLDVFGLNITFLDVSDSFSAHSVLTGYLEECIPRKDTETLIYDDNWLFSIMSAYRQWNPYQNNFKVQVPEKLNTFILRSSALNYEIPSFGFKKNNIKRASFSDNVLHTWTGPVKNVENLISLDLSSNFCSNVSKRFFSEDFKNLKKIILRDNLLGLVLPKDTNGEILRNLHSVDYINLSKIRIANIPKMFFRNQQNLKRLDLSENLIEDINFQVSHMKKLMFVNVKNNKIFKLGQFAMKEFDLVAKSNANFTVDLGSNNLVCNCDSLSFVKWMVTTPTHLYRRNTYECKMSNDTIILHNPTEIFKTLQKECMSYDGIIIGITTGILIFISILFGGISYRFRWKLRYLYYIVKVKWHQTDNESDNKDQRMYMYDVFVSYADEDQTFVHNTLLHKLEKDGGIQLCLHKRNFLPGNDIATNITSAIHNSRKTMVIMSPYYLASYWCMFEYNMARMEGIYERDCENILFLVLYKQISTCDLPLQILELVHCQSYIEYPNDEYGDVVFWEQLKRTIQSC